MGARFRIRKHDGAELTPGSLEAFTRLVSSGEIEELDLIYDALTGEWAPARAHPVYRTVVEGLQVEEDLGLSVVPPEPEPSPEDAARAFIAEMEEERRADPDRPAQPLDFPLVDPGAGDLSRNERPTPPMLAPKTAEPKRPYLRPKPGLHAGPMLLMVFGSLLLVATLIASLRTGPSSLEARAPGVGMSVNAGRALPALERATRRRAVETMQAGARALMREVQAGVIPAGWLDGRYLSSAAEYEDVRDAWYGYDAFVRELRTRESRLHAVAYLGALDAEGVGGALRSLRLARARSDFAAGRAHREEVYGQIEELSLAALSLHELLVQHTGSIRYEPARGPRLSADPVLEAAGTDPESQLLLERALDRVLRALTLDGRGAIQTERIPDWVMGSIDRVLEVTAGTR
ncbi:MAG: hypothetical protein IIB36_13685 [Gemmatimonadetes bacterium]|nr:hypothetical protein [Gemmatimonadota bacterium]